MVHAWFSSLFSCMLLFLPLWLHVAFTFLTDVLPNFMHLSIFIPSFTHNLKNYLFKLPIQHSPNTHIWLIQRHLSLLHLSLARLHEILEGFPCCIDLFLNLNFSLENILYYLHSHGCEILLIVFYCFHHRSLHNCQCPHNPKCFILQGYKSLWESLMIFH